MDKIVDIETKVQSLAQVFDRVEESATRLTQASRQNNTKIFWLLRKVFEANLTPLQQVLVHLTDLELLVVASTCRTLKKLVFSPFGFKMLKLLRPLVVEITKVEDEPVISISMYEIQTKAQTLTGDEDEDDLQAAVMAKSTNILATMHKVKQIELAKKRLNSKTMDMVKTLQQQAQLKESLNQKNVQRLYKIQREEHVLQDCEGHIEDLVLSQEQKIQQKHDRSLTLKGERDKLLQQKELLIKKLKAVMAEAEQQKSTSLEVTNIMNKLEHILKKK